TFSCNCSLRVELQFQLHLMCLRVRFGGPIGGRTRVCIARGDKTKRRAECQKQEKVKTNSGSTCRIRVFSILRTRRSPLLAPWHSCLSSDEGGDPGAES